MTTRVPDTPTKGSFRRTDLGLTRVLAGAVAGGLMIGAIDFAMTRGAAGIAVGDQLLWLLRLSWHWVLAALPLGIAFAAVAAIAAGRIPSVASYAVAVAAGAATGSLVLAVHGKFADTAIAATAIGVDLSLADRWFYGLGQLTFWGFIGALLHASTLRQEQSALILGNSVRKRLHSERDLAEAQLAALQARIEPEFMLSELSRIEALYETDPAAADRRLDGLILFLRQALPSLRSQATTVGDECRLLQIYLNAVIGPDRALRFDLDAGAAPIAIPPGALLSITQRVLAAQPCPGDDFALSLRTWREETGAVNVELVVETGSDPAAASVLDAVRTFEQRLLLSRGPGSSVELDQRSGRCLTLRIRLAGKTGGQS